MLLLLIGDRPWVPTTQRSLSLSSTIRSDQIWVMCKRKREVHVQWLHDFPTTQHDKCHRRSDFLFFSVCRIVVSLLLSLAGTSHTRRLYLHMRGMPLFECVPDYDNHYIALFLPCSRFNCFVAAAAAMDILQHNNNYLDFNEYKWRLGFFFLSVKFRFSFLFSIRCRSFHCMRAKKTTSVGRIV